MARFLWVLVGGMVLLAACSASLDPPKQPIAFSHRVHAGTYRISCQYCHIYVSKSAAAGVPSVQTCFRCHQITAADKPEVKKTMAYWNQGKAIPWLKVHSLADFVYFSHKRHIKKGVPCQTCHGKVETMDQVTQVASLEMGWCVSCHRERGADLDCLVCHK